MELRPMFLTADCFEMMAGSSVECHMASGHQILPVICHISQFHHVVALPMPLPVPMPLPLPMPLPVPMILPVPMPQDPLADFFNNLGKVEDVEISLVVAWCCYIPTVMDQLDMGYCTHCHFPVTRV
jgi:hypothetical protein